MEAQIKEEAEEASLCFESGDNFASMTLVEKYDRFLQNDNSDIDSDADFFPDETLLKEEYAQLRNDTSNYARDRYNNRLSTGIPGRLRNNDQNISVTDEDTIGTFDGAREILDLKKELEIVSLTKLIEKLELVRKCDSDGNSIFCTEEELEAIQERYGDILDFVRDKSADFELSTSTKDSGTNQSEEQGQNGELIVHESSEDFKLLTKKMETVQEARDKFYTVEQQVKDQLEQLELVERYKMESVG